MTTAPPRPSSVEAANGSPSRTDPAAERQSLGLFTRAAGASARQVIDHYSTSFGLATGLLGPRHRQHIRHIYALVRIADEVVDGAAAEAGLTTEEQAQVLHAYLEETKRAVRRGFSTDPVVHAFALTARACGIGDDLIGPFFASMQLDLTTAQHTPDSHRAYVYGSAEVVGLMCLRVFTAGERLPEGDHQVLRNGAAQLGAAFQDVNFLRDLADDGARLGRNYLTTADRLDEAEKRRVIARVRMQLAEAEAAIPLLPRDCRAAVRAAHLLFAALADRIAATEVEDLYRTRVRVPDAVKAALVIRAVGRTIMERA